MSEQSAKQPTSSWRMYPSLSLPQAIEKISMLYAAERRALVPVEIAMKAMGYRSSTSGPSTSARSALKQFGLLEEHGSSGSRKVGVSNDAYQILEGPEHIREAAIRAAALRPPANKLIWDQMGEDAGSDENFAWQLENEYGFSRNGAIDFVKKYKNTLAFAGIVSGDNLEPSSSVRSQEPEGKASGGSDVPRTEQSGDSPRTTMQGDFVTKFLAEHGRDKIPDDPEALQKGAEFVQRFLREHGDRPPATPRDSSGSQQPPLVDAWKTSGGDPYYVARPERPAPAGTTRHAIPLVGGKQVILEGEFPLTEAAWAGFMTVLQAFKPGLVSEDRRDK